MLKKPVSAFLVFAVTLITVAPPRVFAQGPAQSATSTSEAKPSAPPPTPGSDLQKSLAAELANIKAGTLTKAGLKRLEKEQQEQQSGASRRPVFTRKQKIFLALWIVVTTGLVVVLIKHGCKAKPCPEIDNSDSYSDY